MSNFKDLTRDELHERFTSETGLEEIVGRAQEAGLELYQYLDELSPEADRADNALSELLLREELNLKPNKRKGTAKVKDFMVKSKPYRQNLFYAISDKVWETALGLNTLRNRSVTEEDLFRDTNSANSTTANTAFQMPTNLGLYERHRFIPKIDVNDLAWGSDTIDDISFKQPEYVTPPGDEQSNDIAEGGAIEVTLVRFSEVQGKTKKFGGGVAWTDEFALSELRMSLLLMLMRRKGMRDRIRMVNEGVAAALAVAGGTADIPLGSAAFDFGDLLDLALFDGAASSADEGVDNDYNIDTIFCRKEVAKRFIEAFAATGSPGVFSQYPNQFFGNLFNGIQVINNGLGTPLRLGILRDSAVEALDADTALGVDTRYAAQFLEVSGSATMEENRISKNQITERYETRRIGWMITDPEAVVNIGV